MTSKPATGEILWEATQWYRLTLQPSMPPLPSWNELDPFERLAWEEAAHEQNLRDRSLNAHSD